ncbi:MAG: OmpA family protein [Helicobacter sp.]|nr:OmpA family protein [Helicobacter sp.]
MKKYLLLGSIAMALLATGCEVTEGAGANTTETTQPTQGTTDPSQFNTLEERIAYLQDRLQHIRFDYDRFDIRADMVEVLNANTEILKNEASDFDVRLEGNTDEWGSGSYNFALGTKRAVAVRDALRRNGIRTKQVHSYGETNPICTEKTQECWEQNRRVEFKLLPKQ